MTFKKKEIEKNKQQEQILQEQKKLADMGHMVSAIAHQWRQPINALSLYAQEIVEQIRSNECSDEFLNDFEATHMNLIDHLSHTIDDFRSFFKKEC